VTDLSPQTNRQVVNSPPLRNHWLAFAGILLLGGLVLVPGMARWPWDDDEVESLHEMRLFQADHPRLDNPDTQSYRLPRMVPLWYNLQGAILRAVPINEFTARLLPVLCGWLAVVAAFWSNARQRSLLFATVLALLILAHPLFLSLSQQNRYYSMALLWLVLCQAVLFWRQEGVSPLQLALSALLAAGAVLSHGLLLVYFGIALVTSCVGLYFRWISRSVLYSALAQAATAGVVYFVYLGPLMRGWNQTVVSTFVGVWLTFASAVGLPTLVLALLGGAFAVQEGPGEMRWWSLQALLCGLFVAFSPLAISFFHSRYALLFVYPLWMLAALGVVQVARRLRGLPAVCWSAGVIVLLLPGFVSHQIDGSRKDYRKAAELLAGQSTKATPVYCNWPLPLQYYLPDQEVGDWQAPGTLPDGPFFVVVGGSVWDPPLKVPGRMVTLVGTIAKRRLDEQSHRVQVYRVSKPEMETSALPRSSR
jgi:hypothetical protein